MGYGGVGGGGRVLSVFTAILFQMLDAFFVLFCFVTKISSMNIEVTGTHSTNINSRLVPEGKSRSSGILPLVQPLQPVSLCFQASSCA